MTNAYNILDEDDTIFLVLFISEHIWKNAACSSELDARTKNEFATFAHSFNRQPQLARRCKRFDLSGNVM